MKPVYSQGFPDFHGGVLLSVSNNLAMSNVEEVKKEKGWYGAGWAEFFIAFIAARIVQAMWLPNWGMVILLPVSWVIIHSLIGSWMQENAHKDLFGKKEEELKEPANL